jgi:N-acetylglucosaminyldiphosphoundecaprenol N-acetyl-beta-D-mannosaminyltransferase
MLSSGSGPGRAPGQPFHIEVLGVRITACDYEEAVSAILAAAREGRPFAATALAVHGLVAACLDEAQRFRLSTFSLVTPDGQPVRWALRLLHGVRLPDRVYGPTLMLRTCESAARQGLPVYLYGSSEGVLKRLAECLSRRFPALVLAGCEPSKFRRTTPQEKQDITKRIISSGARITFVGLGCPRQEVFAYEYRDQLQMPVIAVGAAFDYHAGLLREPPAWVQRSGLQWLFRLAQEPRRLFWRYCFYNSAFASLLVLEKLGLWSPNRRLGVPPDCEQLHG